jgi:hypothetical protein
MKGVNRMPSYLITNRITSTFSPSAAAFEAWTAWFECLGPHLEDRGNPAFKRTSLGNCGPETVLGGYTLITADDLEGAVALCKSHPLMSLGGGAEIAELTVINAGKELAADGR